MDDFIGNGAIMVITFLIELVNLVGMVMIILDFLQFLRDDGIRMAARV